MRADRLVAILLLLQQRGQVTAAEVADELEVSERTARRDLDALGVAGLPVYAVRGRGGGWRLAGGGRTDLSGMSAPEVRALFALVGPNPDASPEVRAALRKLVRALPEPLRDRAEAAATSTVIDPAAWGRRPRPPAPALLDAVQAAVIDGVQIRLEYVDRQGSTSTRVVHPLGVAAKGATWYLIAGTEAGRRTFRVDRMRSVDPTGDAVDRPTDFDLAGTWSEIVSAMEQQRLPIVVTGRAHRRILGPLDYLLGTRLSVAGAGDGGWVDVVIRGREPYVLAAELAGFSSDLEVLAPATVREALVSIGRELIERYGE